MLDFLREQGFSDEELEVRPLQVQDLLAREWASRDVALRFNGQGQVQVRARRCRGQGGQCSRSADPGRRAAGYRGQWLRRAPLSAAWVQREPQLLEAATSNAREQATRFAEDAGATLGRLKNANQG